MEKQILLPCQSPVPDGPPRLFAMVSTASSRAYTSYALRSFFETTGLRAVDSFVLINNDDPDFDDIVSPYRDHLSVITHSHPQGFAANANLMIERSLETGADLFFMNNDIIFTDNWLTPCLGYDRTIISPISNREVQLAGATLAVKSNTVMHSVSTDAPMQLSDYAASPRAFQALAEANSKSSSGLLKLLVFPFFCVRLPRAVLQTVGKFDERFGMAGGEDYDYAFRAWLAGFDLQMALKSYLIHFWGKSTWSGNSPHERPISYNTEFMEIFRHKWGQPLFQYVLREDDSLIRQNLQASRLLDSGDLAGLIRLLMVAPVDIFIP